MKRVACLSFAAVLSLSCVQVNPRPHQPKPPAVGISIGVGRGVYVEQPPAKKVKKDGDR